jgi:hypothetical protein
LAPVSTYLGLLKNHWTFRGHTDVGKDGREDNRQVHFGIFNNIGSNEGQYARSCNCSEPDSGTNAAYSLSSLSNFMKPLAPASDEGVPLALPLSLFRTSAGDMMRLTWRRQSGERYCVLR